MRKQPSSTKWAELLDDAVVERFWMYVANDVPDHACHNWLGGLNRGYGVFSAKGVSLRAHRVAFVIATGQHIDDNVVVRHLVCHNPTCVNWRHLAIGTVEDNNADRVAQGRSAIGRRNGATKLDPDLVREIRRRADGGESTQAIADDVGVISPNTVRDIRARRTWVWLDGALNDEDDTREDLETADPDDVAAQIAAIAREDS